MSEQKVKPSKTSRKVSFLSSRCIELRDYEYSIIVQVNLYSDFSILPEIVGKYKRVQRDTGLTWEEVDCRRIDEASKLQYITLALAAYGTKAAAGLFDVSIVRLSRVDHFETEGEE